MFEGIPTWVLVIIAIACNSILVGIPYYYARHSRDLDKGYLALILYMVWFFLGFMGAVPINATLVKRILF